MIKLVRFYPPLTSCFLYPQAESNKEDIDTLFQKTQREYWSHLTDILGRRIPPLWFFEEECGSSLSGKIFGWQKAKRISVEYKFHR
jgi:hypothetical protein